jgi:GNAT superfamily N-acetyltransferase
MEPIEAAPLTMERLTSRAIPDALRLSMDVGWNQTADDWAVFVDHGRIAGVLAAGELVATAATIPYGAFGYVAMVIVRSDHRKRGLAGRLLREAMAGLIAQHRTPMLDATPDGAMVYRRLGFVDVCSLRRWEGVAGESLEVSMPQLRVATSDDGVRLIKMDEAAFGASRHFLITDFVRRAGTQVLIAEDGFVMRRRGVQADQIGPLVAGDAHAAANLLAAALAMRPGPVFLDLFDRWDALAAPLERQGFVVQRPFTRMALGATTARGDPARLFVAAGPEFG